MSTSSISNSSESVNNFTAGDIIEHRDHSWCYGYVIEAATACGGRISGWKIQTIVNTEERKTGRVEFIPAEAAVLVCAAPVNPGVAIARKLMAFKGVEPTSQKPRSIAAIYAEQKREVA